MPGTNEVRNSAWWKIALTVEEAEIGMSACELCDALRVEGVKASMQYLPRPIFDEPVLQDANTYGTSGFPLRDGEWRLNQIADFPGYQEFDRTTVLLPWSSRMTVKTVNRIAEAVHKVIGTGRLKSKSVQAESPELVTAS